MCGRFTLTLPDFEALAELVGAAASPRLAARYRRRWNIAPSDAHWIVVASDPAESSTGGRQIVPATWGFSDRKLPLAQAEHAKKRETFREAFAQHRCLVPADGFYEWTGEKGERVPYWFHAADAAPLLMGALYEDTPDGARFAILTTAANATVAKIHDRMPLIVERAEIDRWLRGSDPEVLLQPAKDDLLLATEVSTRVNSAKNDDAACLEEVTDEKRGQLKLFRTS